MATLGLVALQRTTKDMGMTMDNDTGPAVAEEPGTAVTAPERKASIMLPIAQPAELIRAQNEMRQLIKQALKQGVAPGTGDYGEFPGTDKKALYKPGAEKIALGMGCYYGPPRIVEREINHNCVNEYTYEKKSDWRTVDGKRRPMKVEEMVGKSHGLYRYVIAVDVINRATQEIVGQGIGSCSTMESKYISRPRDCENTVVKMAHKRAIVGACLISFGLSGEFGPAEEDEDDDQQRQPGDESEAKPKAKAAASSTGPVPKCSVCGGRQWDNRAKKAAGEYSANSPDFNCQDKNCASRNKKAAPAKPDLEEQALPFEKQ